MFIHEWKCLNFLLFKHSQLTSSCDVWSELFRISIGIFTGRTQCFTFQDRGQGHKRSCSCCRNHAVCVMLFTFSPQVSSLQAGGGTDPPEREDASNLLSEWCDCVCVSSLSRCARRLQCTDVIECPSLTADETALRGLCWIPFGIKTVSIEAKGGILCLEPTSDDIQVTKEDTIFVEVPPDAVCTSADVKMRYAIIPSGPFTLPEGYQFGSPVVYIYYDGRQVTKPLALHLPHWYGGEDHARDGLSFAVAPHSLKGRSVYHFQLLAGGKFPSSSRCGVVAIHGHCSLYAEVFKLGATKKYLATFLVKEEKGKTKCNLAVTYDSTNWAEVITTVLQCSFGMYVLKWFVCLYVILHRYCGRDANVGGKCQSMIRSNSSRTGSLPHLMIVAMWMVTGMLISLEHQRCIDLVTS